MGSGDPQGGASTTAVQLRKQEQHRATPRLEAPRAPCATLGMQHQIASCCSGIGLPNRLLQRAGKPARLGRACLELLWLKGAAWLQPNRQHKDVSKHEGALLLPAGNVWVRKVCAVRWAGRVGQKDRGLETHANCIRHRQRDGRRGKHDEPGARWGLEFEGFLGSSREQVLGALKAFLAVEQVQQPLQHAGLRRAAG